MNLPQFAFRPSLPLAFAIGACLMLFTTQVVSAAAATLKVDPSPIWAGNIAVGQSATLTTTLSNSGPQSVTVSKASSNNSAYSVSSPSFPLSLVSGKSVKVTINFAPKSAQRMIGTITFGSNAADPSLALALNGWGVSANVSASPASVNFGSVASGGSSSVSETLTNSGSASLTISSANTNGSAFARTGISPPLTLAPAHSITFKVLFMPKSSGAASGSLTVVSNAGNLTIPLSGNAAAGGTLAVSPAAANLGSVPVGSSNTMSATLSAANSNVVVSSATTTSSEFTVSGMSLPLTIAAGKSVSLTVKFAPSSSGTATGKLTFMSNASNSPAVESLTGTGAATTQHEVGLSWKASTSTVAGYNVYRGSESGGPYAKVNSSEDASTAYSDTAVQAGQTYYYVVTGVSAQGTESAYSNQVTAVVP